jgi:hypothetical protein
VAVNRFMWLFLQHSSDARSLLRGSSMPKISVAGLVPGNDYYCRILALRCPQLCITERSDCRVKG